jgi:serine/threonine-protein kinase
MVTIKLPNGVFEYDPALPLGQAGGFGQVFSGKAANGEEVAVKKLHMSAANIAHRELRIAEEFRGKAFQHVIPFIDSGEDADSGGYFVIMPRAERSLQATVDNGPLKAGEAAKVLLEIVNGLIEVGDIVHRDLKPDNILLHQGRWKVADFGIARFIEEATSGQTLKGFVSPHYAAPEQWRLERATHATDTYALGCITFCLLTGKPPFTTNPSEEHQNAQVPSFICDDTRLISLVHLMMRKPPASRPVLSRVRDLLIAINAKPQQAGGTDSLSLLAEAGAVLSEREQALEAQQKAHEAALRERAQLTAEAVEILAGNVERLWGKIHAQVANANRRPDKELICSLGMATLSVPRCVPVESGLFKQSGWDILVATHIAVHQVVPKKGECYWSSSLWYGKPKNGSELRWYEVSFSDLRRGTTVPFACGEDEDVDLALSPLMHAVNVVFGPAIADDEKEDEFHERWIWLLAKASLGKLSQPSSLPINVWPPHLL